MMRLIISGARTASQSCVSYKFQPIPSSLCLSPRQDPAWTARRPAYTDSNDLTHSIWFGIRSEGRFRLKTMKRAHARKSSNFAASNKSRPREPETVPRSVAFKLLIPAVYWAIKQLAVNGPGDWPESCAQRSVCWGWVMRMQKASEVPHHGRTTARVDWQ